jgi:PepSY-associated TM region
MHLGAGVLLSALVLYFSVTGAILVYERQVLQAADKRFYSADPVPLDGVPLPLDSVVAGAVASVPQLIEMLTLHHDNRLPLEILSANRSVYFVDRNSGRVQGPVSPRIRGFFAEVTALHRWFGLSAAHHAAATAVKGAATLLLLFLLLSRRSFGCLRRGRVLRSAGVSCPGLMAAAALAITTGTR